MARTLFSGAQIRPGTIAEDRLDSALQAKVANINVNTLAIAEINNSKGAAGGLAALGADAKLLASQVPATAIIDWIGDVTNVAEMTALTAQKGDWCTRTDEGKDYICIGDPTVEAGWRPMTTPSGGVTSINGNQGALTLHQVAFTGLSEDIVFAHADYTATDVKAALVEVMAKANNIDTAYQQADATLQGNIDTLAGQLGDKVAASAFHNCELLGGTIDGTNKQFTLPRQYAFGLIMQNGQVLVAGDDYTVAADGVTVDFVGSPDPGDKMYVAGLAA